MPPRAKIGMMLKIIQFSAASAVTISATQAKVLFVRMALISPSGFTARLCRKVWAGTWNAERSKRKIDPGPAPLERVAAPQSAQEVP